jgi:hypothetical protein
VTFDDQHEVGQVMSKIDPIGKGIIRGLPRRGLSIAAIIALLATFIVPIGVGAANALTVTISNDTHAVGQSAVVTAVLNPAPVDGTVVTFTITGPNGSKSGTAETGDGPLPSGTAEFSYTGTNPGTDVIQASSTGYPSETVTAYWTELTLTPDSQLVAQGSLVQVGVQLDNDGDGGISNVPICYTISGANAQTQTCGTHTNSAGTATISYVATDTGTDTIIAFADTNPAPPNGNGTEDTYEADASAEVSVTNLSVSLDPSSQTVNTGANAELTATVTDDGNSDDPVEGQRVRFIVNGDHNRAATDVTDNNGEATMSYTESTSGTDTVRAFVDLDNDGFYDVGEPTDTATVTWIGYELTLTPSSQNQTIGSEASLNAHLTSDNEDTDDVPIRFSVSGPNATSDVDNTNVNGDASFSYVGHTGRTDTVTAYADLNNSGTQNAGEPSDTATVTWGDTFVLTLQPSTQNAVKGTTVSVTATATHVSGAASGAAVRYSITGANPGSGVVTTDANGNATISYTGANTGTDTINAYLDLDNDNTHDTGEPSATATVDVTGNVSMVLSPAIQNVAVNTSASVTATLTSGDTSLNGITIRWVATGANSHSGAVMTNSSGVATISYTGTATGTDYVWAFADLNNDGSLSTGEPATTVTVDWTTGGSTPPPTTAPDAANPTTAKAGCMYFPETQHNLCGDFANYWNTYGGLAIFGFPITETFQENGLTVQYTERGRFEAHPGTGAATFNTLLGLVGNEVTAGRSSEAPFQPAASKAGPDCTYYAETGHNLCAGFRAYWEKYGGLAIYGFPISEEFQEVNPDTGKTYTVQYFQRGRYEWHPGEWPERFDVELGRLGSQVFSMKYGTEYH